MKEKIKQIRVRIDGLAGLIKADLDKPIYIVDANSIPDGMTMKEVMERLVRNDPVTLHNVKHETIQPNYSMSFVFEAYKSLLLAKAWLGKVLAELGEETPYKSDGKRNSVKDIEPTADQYDFKGKVITPEGIESMTYVGKIDWLREEIKNVATELDEVCWDEKKEGALEYLANVENRVWENIDYSTKHLSEARFHLGFELGRIKELEG